MCESICAGLKDEKCRQRLREKLQRISGESESEFKQHARDR